MNISKIQFINLYGYLSRTITFNEEMSVLVGPNGSGKTTVFNVINWLLAPDISTLCKTIFDIIELEFEIGNQLYQIKCSKVDNYFYYEVSVNNNIYPPLTVKINENDDDYLHLSPTKEELPTWNLILGLPKPLFIGLDRLIFSVDNERSANNRGIQRKVRNEKPLENAVNMVKNHYIKQNSIILNLTAQLNNTLVLSNFNKTITIDDFSKITQDYSKDIEETRKEVQNLNQRLYHYLVNFIGLKPSDIEKSDYNTYFKNLLISVDHLNEMNSAIEEKLYRVLAALNFQTFEKLKLLMVDFDKFENRYNTILARIDLFIRGVNAFFKDTNKEIYIDKNNGNLMVKFYVDKTSKSKKTIEVDKLSSGEQQLIVILSYLVFSIHKDQIFIIDEPELSLHVKWQENLLKVIKESNAGMNQILVATHSPLIVNDFRECVIPLNFQNNG